MSYRFNFSPITFADNYISNSNIQQLQNDECLASCKKCLAPHAMSPYSPFSPDESPIKYFDEDALSFSSSSVEVDSNNFLDSSEDISLVVSNMNDNQLPNLFWSANEENKFTNIESLNTKIQSTKEIESNTTITILVGKFSDGFANATNCYVRITENLKDDDILSIGTYQPLCNLRSAWQTCMLTIISLSSNNNRNSTLICRIVLPMNSNSYFSSEFGPPLRYHDNITSVLLNDKFNVIISIISNYTIPLTSTTIPSKESKANIIGDSKYDSRFLYLSGIPQIHNKWSVVLSSLKIQNFGNLNTQGGAIYISNIGNIFFQNVELLNNLAIDGGSLYITNSNNLIITFSIFHENKAQNTGGAITIAYSSNISYSNNDCYNNTASATFWGGGCLFLTYSNTVTIVNSLFHHNLINSNPWWGGGGIYINGSKNIKVYNVSFIDNIVSGISSKVSQNPCAGGLAIIYVIKIEVYNCYFGNNKVLYGSAGGLYGFQSSGVTLQVSRFNEDGWTDGIRHF